MKRSARLVAMLTATALVLAGLIVGGGAVSAQEKPQKGGGLTMIGYDVPTFNPATAGAFSNVGSTLYAVYGALASENPHTGEVEGFQLKTFTSTPDATVWTLKLNPDIKFSDGTALDSAAIKANFEYMANPANRATALATMQEIASMDATDPLVLKVTLKAANAAWAHNVCVRGPFMVSPTALAKYGAEYGTAIDKVVGAGPFVLTSWTRGSQLEFKRNDAYWDAPRPYLDTLTIKVIGDDAAAYNTLLTHGADTWVPTTASYTEQGEAAGMRVIPKSYQNISFRSVYRFNVTRPPFNDLLARQAVTTAVDAKKLAAAVGRPVATNVANKGNEWYNANAALPKYNAKEAQDLINQWSAKNGGKPLEFTIPIVTGNAALGGGGEALQAVFAGYQNLKANVVTVASVTANTALGQSGNFDLHPSAYGGSDPDIAWATALGTGGGQNYGKYSNPEMDAALAAGKATTVKKERKKQYDKVQELIVTDLPSFVMPYVGYTPDQMLINNKALRDLEAGQMSNLQTDKVWIAQKK